MIIHFANPHLHTLPPGHRFPMEKYALLRHRLGQALPQLRWELAEPATPGELALVHTPSYIDAVFQGTLTTAEQREIGFTWSEGMVERARRSVGATIAAARRALTEGFSANLAGGTHHAYAHKGGGFCVFNDVAVAARLMQAEQGRIGRRLRVAVLDLDVHQGNGTAHIFANDPQVFTVSVHGEKNFPFRKEASDWDMELPDGCTDEPYLEAVEQALQALSAQALPDLLFYLAGADPYEGDRLGRLAVSAAGLQARDQRVLDWAHQREVPVAMAMAGGYGRVIAETVEIQVQTFTEGWRHWQRCQGWQNPAP